MEPTRKLKYRNECITGRQVSEEETIIRPQGPLLALAGDWVVTFQNGEVSVYTDEYFKEIFEVLDD